MRVGSWEDAALEPADVLESRATAGTRFFWYLLLYSHESRLMPNVPRTNTLPGEPTSPWLAETLEEPPVDSSAPSSDERPSSEEIPLEQAFGADDDPVDVAVIGAGIAGLSTAFELREQGQTVLVLERDRVGTGVTGKSTAKLTSQHGQIYDHLTREFGSRQARQYAQTQEDAIDTVEQRIADLGIECGFERVPSYLYSNEPDTMEREAEAARAAGLDATYVTSVPPFERSQAGVRFDEQAWFHPRKYLLGIADALAEDDDATIAEGTEVTDLEPGSPCQIRANGQRVRARQVVLATGFPIFDRAGYFARMHPKRSYVLGVRLDGRPPEGMYYRPGDPYRSVRTHRDEDGELLLVGGENHKTGQGGSTIDRYQRLLRWTREHFPVRSVEYHWSTQDYVPADQVPLVGRAGPRTENVSVATGFRGWGMTNGVAAGRLLAGLIAGDQPSTRSLFDRFDSPRSPRLERRSPRTQTPRVRSQLTGSRRCSAPTTPPSSPAREPSSARVGNRSPALAMPTATCIRPRPSVPHVLCRRVERRRRQLGLSLSRLPIRLDGEVLEGPATDPLPTRDTQSER